MKRFATLLIALLAAGRLFMINPAASPLTIPPEDGEKPDIIGLDADDIISEAAILMDADTGQVLFEKNSHQIMYPASTTKIMTGLLVAQRASANETILISQNVENVYLVEEPESSHIALRAGEKITVADAMYALMLPSANDAAVALAEFIAGDQATFSSLMTQTAHEIGALDTNFTNPHGLHSDDHYTTAYDLALITRYAMQNPTFMEYFGAPTYVMPATNLQEEERPFQNLQHMLRSEMYYYNPDVIGGKTGYTLEARHTMSTVATRNGRNLICVVMNSPVTYDKFKDTWLLLDYGFDEFVPFTLPGDLFQSLSLPVEQEGISVGSALFSHEGDIRLLIHTTMNPNDIRVSYSSPEVFELNDPRDAAVVLEVDSQEVAGMPLQLLSVPMESTLDIEVLPVFGFGSLEEQEKSVAAGMLPYLLVCGVGVALLFVAVTLLLRQRALKKRRLAREARLAARRRASQSHSRGYSSGSRRSPSYTSNSYQARR